MANSCNCNICDTCLQNIIFNFNNHTTFICLNDTPNTYTNTSTTYDIGPLQQTNNFYTIPNSNFNFVFECTALNVSAKMTTDPLLLSYLNTSQIGFGNVSATATLNVTSSQLNGLFIYSTNETMNLSSITFDELYYGVSAEIFNFNYSNALVKKADKYIPLYQDYVESLSEQVLNGYGTIFSNVPQIISTVQALDSKFNVIFNQSIRNSSGLYQGDTNTFSKCCRNLITGVLNLAKDTRKDKFFTDLTTQLGNPILSFVFNTSDVMAIELTYKPRNSTLLSTITPIIISPRTYKIFLNVI
jgi:hypothetical protein